MAFGLAEGQQGFCTGEEASVAQEACLDRAPESQHPAAGVSSQDELFRKRAGQMHGRRAPVREARRVNSTRAPVQKRGGETLRTMFFSAAATGMTEMDRLLSRCVLLR